MLRLRPDGRIEVLTGTTDQGAGAYTMASRVAAAVLSVDPRRVVVTHTDTDGPARGVFIGGSRVTHLLGRAVQDGAEQLKVRLEELAAEAMGWRADEVRLCGDRFVAGADEAPFDVVAERIARGAAVETIGSHNKPHTPDEPGHYQAVGYIVEVEVDPETGAVRVLDVLLAADVGTIINPVAHQGQVDGALLFGFGQAFMEDLSVQDGQVAVGTLGDYKLPCVMDIPPFRTVLLQEPTGPGPLGAKAAGELTNTAFPPAVANAIAAACGARLQELPVTSERVLAALETAKSRQVAP
jgi:CO/xanthine dehydrogenase Mo-binding subunit